MNCPDATRAPDENSEEAVVDFAGVAEVEDQRQGHALDGGHQLGEAHDAGQQQGGEVSGGEPDAGQDFAEDEEEEQRLDEGLEQELSDLAAGDCEIAPKSGEEGVGGQPQTIGMAYGRGNH